MALEISVDEVNALSELAWKLYQHGFKVARAVSPELQLLFGEISVLANSTNILKEDACNPGSVLVQAGGDRIQIVNEMVARIKMTLSEAEKFFTRHEIFSEGTNSKKRSIWAMLRSSTGFGSVDSVRRKLSYHNTYMNLLLTSTGNSSLNRLELAFTTLETDIAEIKGFIRETAPKVERNEHFDLTSGPFVDDEPLPATLSAKLMHNAQASQPWDAVGIERWIQIGRWWLLKFQTEFLAVSASDSKVPAAVYIHVIKASWIFLDIVACHSQLSFLDPNSHPEVSLFPAELKIEFHRIKNKGLLAPELSELKHQDLQIWEVQEKEPLVRSGQYYQEQAIGASSNLWMVGEEAVYFQRFASYRRNNLVESPQSLISFLVHKTTSKARLIAQDQNGTKLMELAIGRSLELNSVLRTIAFGNEEITFRKNGQDATLLCSVFEAYRMYHFDFDQNIVGLSGFKGLLLMVTVKNRCGEAIMQLVEESEAEVDPINEHGQNALKVGLALASEYIRRHVSSDTLHSASSAPETTMSLLTWAVIHGHVEVLGLLIAYGANITEKNHEGITNLKQALEHEHEEVARLLLANGADFDIEAVPEGRTLLHVAASNGSEMEMRLLLEQGLEVDATDEEHLTSLHWAAWNGHRKVAQLLIQSGANLDAKSDMGNTALHLVMSNKDHTGPGDGDMVRWLLAKGSQINACDNRKWTPLHLAASNGYTEIVDILLEHGPDIEAKTLEGCTPLHLAAWYGHRMTFEYLLNNGAMADATTNRGWTALHFFAAKGYCRSADIIVNRIADTEAEDDFGQTPLQLAAANERTPMIRLLLDRGTSSQARRAAFRTAASAGNTEILQMIYQRKMNLEASDRNGCTALLLAALHGHTDVVRMLLLYGADITSKMGSGWSALHCAVSRRHTSVVELLLENKIEVNYKCEKGSTALHIAASIGDLTITKLLQDKGADIKAPDDYGLTPVQRAAGNDHINLVSLLLSSGENTIPIWNSLAALPLTRLRPEDDHLPQMNQDAVALFEKNSRGLQKLEYNWDQGLCKKSQLPYFNDTDGSHHHGPVYMVRCSPRHAVSCGKDKNILVWDLHKRILHRHYQRIYFGKQTAHPSLPGHAEPVLCCDFDDSPAEGVIISGSGDKNVSIWRFSSGAHLHTIKNAHEGSILSLKFDRKYLVTASTDKTVKVWNRHEIDSANDEFSWIYQSVDLEAFKLRETSGPVIPPYSELRVLSEHTAAIYSVQLLDDEIVSASADCSVRVWCILTGVCLLHIAAAHTHGITSVHYDGTYIVTGSKDSTVGVFNRLTGSKIVHLEGHTQMVRSVQSEIYDMTHLGGEPSIRDDLVSQVLHKPCPSDQTSFRRGSKIVSASYDETLKLWRRDQKGSWFLHRTLLQESSSNSTFNRILSVHFNSRFLVYATEDGIQCWDFANDDPDIDDALRWVAQFASDACY